MKRATGPAASSRATPLRSAIAVRTMSTRESGSSTQSTGTSWIRSPRRCASTSSSVSKNQPSSLTSSSRFVERVAADGLEAALGVAEAGAQDGVQEAVVAARDELALGAAHDPRAVRQPRADREVAVAGHQRRDEREQAAQVGREIDVHVGHDARVARLPGGAQRAAAALAVEPQVADPRAACRRAGAAISGVASTLALSAIDDPPGEREAVGEEAMQAADAALQPGGLVVDGDDDLDVRRRGGREGPPGGDEGGGELWHAPSIGAGRQSPLGSP